MLVGRLDKKLMLIKLSRSTRSCLEIRMQDEVTVKRTGNKYFERVEQFKYLGNPRGNKIQFRNKLRAA